MALGDVVDKVGIGQRLDLMIWKDFSNLNDPVILWDLPSAQLPLRYPLSISTLLQKLVRRSRCFLFPGSFTLTSCSHGKSRNVSMPPVSFQSWDRGQALGHTLSHTYGVPQTLCLTFCQSLPESHEVTPPH